MRGGRCAPVEWESSRVSLEAAGVLREQFLSTAVRWDTASHSAVLDVTRLPAGQWQLEVSSGLLSAQELATANVYVSSFTAVMEMSSQVTLSFANTRADRLTGAISYDVNVTNIGLEDIRGPLTLLLDPLKAFSGAITDAQVGTGLQSGLWLLDLSAGLQAFGNKLPVGATLANQTVTIRPLTAVALGLVALVKADLSHGIYALPQANIPPVLGVSIIDPEALPDDEPYAPDLEYSGLEDAVVGTPWTTQLEAIDADGTVLHWQLVSAPQGVSLTPDAGYTLQDDGYHYTAQLRWTPTARALADSEMVVRIQDSRGGTETRRFYVSVDGGNHAPVINSFAEDIRVVEGETLHLPMAASDLDGQGVWGVTEQEMHLSHLPAIIRTIFPRFNLINMAMPPICLATNII